MINQPFSSAAIQVKAFQNIKLEDHRVLQQIIQSKDSVMILLVGETDRKRSIIIFDLKKSKILREIRLGSFKTPHSIKLYSFRHDQVIICNCDNDSAKILSLTDYSFKREYNFSSEGHISKKLLVFTSSKIMVFAKVMENNFAMEIKYYRLDDADSKSIHSQVFGFNEKPTQLAKLDNRSILTWILPNRNYFMILQLKGYVFGYKTVMTTIDIGYRQLVKLPLKWRPIWMLEKDKYIVAYSLKHCSMNKIVNYSTVKFNSSKNNEPQFGQYIFPTLQTSHNFRDYQQRDVVIVENDDLIMVKNQCHKYSERFFALTASTHKLVKRFIYETKNQWPKKSIHYNKTQWNGAIIKHTSSSTKMYGLSIQIDIVCYQIIDVYTHFLMHFCEDFPEDLVLDVVELLVT